MDGVFLSEDLGVEKPNVLFFEKVFESIGPVDKSEVIIVGDSLTSDICGGNNVGIKTCWYNPSRVSVQGNYHIDYEISDLHEIFEIVK